MVEQEMMAVNYSVQFRMMMNLKNFARNQQSINQMNYKLHILLSHHFTKRR